MIRRSIKTSQFRHISRAFQYSRFLVKHPKAEAALLEAINAQRRGLDSEISRRRFVTGLIKVGIVLSVPAGPWVNRSFAQSTGRRVGGSTVAIVGAGFAGLAAAYHLTKAGVPCEIFEASARVGGRVFTHDGIGTKQAFNRNEMFCELGAELVDSNHDDIFALCSELEIGKPQSIVDGDKNVEHVLYHQGGNYYYESDMIEAFKPLARRLERDQEELYRTDEGDDDVAERLDAMSLESYLSRAKDCDSWVRKALGGAYRNEYGLEIGEQSALNFVDYIDPDTSQGFLKVFGESDESFRIPGGNSQLTYALEKHLSAKKVPVHKGNALVAIKQQGDRRIQLTFRNRSGGQSNSWGQVIMAIPFSVLRNVEGVSALDLSKEKQNCISNLGYGTNCKLMLGFRQKYWRRDDIGVKPSNCNIYTDLPSQEFWETSRGQEGVSGIVTNFMGGHWGRDWNKEKTSQALEDLGTIFPGVKGKTPAINQYDDGNDASFHWPSYKWSKGSYSCAKVNQYWSLLDAAAYSELDDRLQFAGEHTSQNFGGFMNGALESGRIAAATVIGSRRSSAVKKAG